MLERLSLLISSGAYSGFLPKAPGTFGSIAGVAAWWIASLPFDGVAPLYFVPLIVIVGWTSVSHQLELNRDSLSAVRDPQWIVIDEWVGIWIALMLTNPNDKLHIFMGFLLFRVFDIIKPGPIKWCERLPGATGILMDDVAAGFVAFIILNLFF